MANDEYIWNFLKTELKNEYGVAGLMGNLKAESALSPTNLQDSFNKAWNVTDEQFTQMVDNGQFNFCCNDKGAWGYGLAQWTSVGRRINLWNYKCQKQVSIGDLTMQLEFLMQELKTGYKSVYNALISAKSVREASDAVLLKFEIPYDRSESVQKYRSSLGEQFYNKFAKGDNKPIQVNYEEVARLYRVKTEKGLNVREMPTTDSSVIKQMKYETLFAVDKITTDNWGHIPVLDGWTCLDYATKL